MELVGHRQDRSCDGSFRHTTSEMRMNCSRRRRQQQQQQRQRRSERGRELECLRSPPSSTDNSNDVNCQFRKMRNLSEKKRRDQFNLLINELSSMVSTSTRKMDKSSVLKSTIAFLRNHNEQESEIALSSEAHQVEEDWKPPFLSNEEFAHVMLEALDGFIIAFATNGRISYVSESIASLLGYLPNEVLNMTIYDLVHEDSRSEFYEVLNSHSTNVLLDSVSEDQISFVHYMKRGPLDDNETAEQAYELVRFVGNYVQWYDGSYDHVLQSDHAGGGGGGGGSYTSDNDRMQSTGEFVATVMLQTPQLLREMTLSSDDDVAKSEFISRHSLEWKFLFLDPRAPPIIGYLPFEVLGTSGYDYYHVDDLEKIVACHEALMQTGEGTCSYYRFLTKGQQWLWLQTRYYITYHQWNSKPEFIVCTHIVVSCAEARLQLRKETSRQDNVKSSPSSSSLMQSSGNQRTAATLPPPASSHTSNQRTDETRASPHRTQEQNVGSASGLKHTSLNATSEKSSSVSGGSPRKGHAAFVGHSGHQRATSCVQETPNQSGEHESNPFGTPSHSAMTPPMEQFAIHQPTTQPLRHDCDQATGNRAVGDANATIAQQKQQQQSDLQEQLRCKHQILQEQILQQQEELQRIQEQLMFAQFAPQGSTAISANDNQQMQYATSGAFQPSTMPMAANPSTSSLENQETIQFQFSQQDDGRMEFRDTHDDGQLDKRL